MVIDSRSCRSAPSCFARGIDGGKKIRGVKIQMAVEKYGIPLAIDVAPANCHDTKAIVPVLRELADGGFQGPAMGDLGYRGKRLAKAGQALGVTVEAIARGRDGQFMPAGICWVVELSFAWLSRYRRLNAIFERSKEHLIAFIAIAFISITLAASSASSSRNSAPDVYKQTLNVAFRFGGTPYEASERGLRLFLKEVLPVLKSWRPVTGTITPSATRRRSSSFWSLPLGPCSSSAAKAIASDSHHFGTNHRRCVGSVQRLGGYEGHASWKACSCSCIPAPMTLPEERRNVSPPNLWTVPGSSAPLKLGEPPNMVNKARRIDEPPSSPS